MDENNSKHLDTLVRHIQTVQNGCLLLGERLIENGEEEFARRLISNGFSHDQSKFHGIEWKYLVCKFDISTIETKLAIQQHVTTNLHHPEAWESINEMPKIFLFEAVADWWARSSEFGSCLRDWISEKATPKYQLKPHGKAAKDINNAVNLLLEKTFK